MSPFMNAVVSYVGFVAYNVSARLHEKTGISSKNAIPHLVYAQVNKRQFSILKSSFAPHSMLSIV